MPELEECPVLGTADRANNTLILDNLLQHLQVRTLHSLSIAGMEVIEIIKRETYDTTVLKDGDVVEILQFMGGGSC